ncbi:molybdopterin molybdotransferase MoeA [Naasia lichenicola]|uniref:molybdopterin molybdotransferase MoeA n=1 Tax=Naasia lichenicola TaxID=2565933 RepID=UPI001E5593DD|nr:gephyrin-like molybdotransferase Glp [Naasia lichenicola]
MSAVRSVEEHRAAVEALLEPLARSRVAEALPVSPAAMAAAPDRYRARVLVDDLRSPSDLPPFDNSQMDGYAVRAADLTGAAPDAPLRLPLAPQINAGDAAPPLAPGVAAAVMTGAPIPSGADAVVPIEHVEPPRFSTAGAPVDEVAFAAAPHPEAFVRRAGSDVRAGDVLLAAGTPLAAAQYGVIAGTGLREIAVLRRTRVLVVPTGHEIREPGSRLEPGQIYDSNGALLASALLDAGCTVAVKPCRSDDAERLLAILTEHAAEVDLLITVGGVSAGAREVVRDALAPLGVQFGSVAMQPGGPQGIGAIAAADRDERLPVVSFPGNPVSALVSFELFLRPILRRLAGAARPERPVVHAPLAAAVDSPAAKHQIRRGRLDDDGAIELVGGASSHLLHSYANSSLLVHLPVGLERAGAGDRVEAWRIDD